MNTHLNAVSRFRGNPRIPGDKSISHRALLLGALADGESEISNLLESGDVLSTWNSLLALGTSITSKFGRVYVQGKGKERFQKPDQPLDCGNSGTTLRLLMGILSGCPFSVHLKGDPSLSRRPMRRIADPLLKMGARIELTGGETAPVQVHGTSLLSAIDYTLPVASAQLKSAILLAGLFASGETRLRGKIESRDHTERLFPHFGVELTRLNDEILMTGQQTLRGAQIMVPGDFSSAAYWIAAALLIPGANLELQNVSLNPTRTGLLEVLRRMGARIEIQVGTTAPEPIGQLRVTSSPLQATQVRPEEIPHLIDEIPLLAVLGTFAEGVTEVRGAQELRVKETDRIEAVAQNLRAMGVLIDTFPDGFSITGPQRLRGARVDSFHDHRIAMAFSVAALRAVGPTEIRGSDCVQISYPQFFDTLRDLTCS